LPKVVRGRKIELADEQERSLVARSVEVAAESAKTLSEATVGALPDQLDAAAIERLKSIIAEFDKSNRQ